MLRSRRSQEASVRPWQHARASSGKAGDWQRDLPIHEFLDATKLACPDLRHRMILHNADLGPSLAARVFADREDARAIALRHVDEDLGWTPTLADWLDACEIRRLPAPPYRRRDLDFEELPDRVAHAQGLRDRAGPAAILDLLLTPTRLAGPHALAVLFNGFGPALARAVFGGPRPAPGRHGAAAVFDPAHAAEATIYATYGAIPSLTEVVAAAPRPPAPPRA
jgi:hypothetical protein